jgi:NADH-quinone oxidoreductase subunit C
VTEQTEQDPVVARVQEQFGEPLLGVTAAADAVAIEADRDQLVDLAIYLRDDAELAFGRLVDVTAVDYLTQDRIPRFVVVYHFHSIALHRYVRIRVPVDEDDAVVPSLVEWWPGANLFEREIHEMYGIDFAGHPNLANLLLPDDWDVHPLRKDFQPPKEPIEFSFNPDQWQKAVPRGN